MSGFTCNPSIIPPVTATAEPAVEQAWFPAIDPVQLREAWRIGDAVKAARLRSAIVGAIVTVGNQLTAWATAHILAGYASLAEVPAPAIDGESGLVHLYLRAIGATVKAELVERTRDTDLTGDGQRRIEELDPSIGELRRDALHAIRDMLGTTRTTIELL